MIAPDYPMTLGTLKDGSRCDLSMQRAPHILIAGMTGAGKSVLVHQLLSELLAYDEHEIKLVLLDPKRVEFARYIGNPNLVEKPAYDEGRMKILLLWAIDEMNLRYHQMEQGGWLDIDGQWAGAWEAGAWDSRWPRLVIVIDELANLILADKKIEEPIVRLASMGRAAGVHLILATQRPSADVITGLIRANVPTRICLPVVSRMDSRIILDEAGGEKLEKPGQMLARLPGKRELVRIDGLPA